METRQYLEQHTSNSERVAEAASAAGLAARVPSCPDWTVADLLDHLVHGDDWARRITARAREGITERTDPEAPADEPEGDARVPYFLAGARALEAELAAVDPHAPAWTFSAADRTASFWIRRRAHETAVHRYDAELAAGTPTPVEAELAADGVDEFLGLFLPRLGQRVAALGDVSIHLHSTDVDGEWVVTSAGGSVTVTQEHAKGDVAARGTASDLLLFLWGRVPAESLEVFGDAELLERFRAALTV
jgi:uncharacterized protein (TIGR03083 family)